MDVWNCGWHVADQADDKLVQGSHLRWQLTCAVCTSLSILCAWHHASEQNHCYQSRRQQPADLALPVRTPQDEAARLRALVPYLVPAPRQGVLGVSHHAERVRKQLVLAAHDPNRWDHLRRRNAWP